MKFKDMIIAEAAYPGNIGIMELIKFNQKATPAERQEMKRIIDDSDWNRFKELIKKVLGVELK